MVKFDENLYNFTDGPVTRRLSAQGEADAVAEFDPRRGFRLSANAHAAIANTVKVALASSSDPEAAESASASVTAGVGVSTRTALAAQLNVNGLWAEGCAAGEARVQVLADVKVTGQMLLDALRVDEALPRGALVPALALLKEVDVHAGAFAEMFFAFRGRCRLMVSGSVIPQEGRDAGIVVKFDYGYAYIWGAGVSGYIGFDLPDAGRVVSVVANNVVDELSYALPAGTPLHIDTLLRLIVPLASSAAVAIGEALGPPQSSDPGAGAVTTDPVGAFLAELRMTALSTVLTALLDAAKDAVTELVDLALNSVAITDDVRAAGLAALTDAKVFLDELDTAEVVIEALPSLIGLCDRLADFTASTPELSGFAAVSKGLTVTVAVAEILQQLSGADSLSSLPTGSVHRIQNRVGTATDLNVLDLATYIGLELGVLQGSPLSSVEWLSDIVGCAAPDLIRILWTLGEGSDPDQHRTLATSLVQGLRGQLTDHLRPFLDSFAPDSEIRALADFIEPLLEVVEVALLPALAVTTRREAARSRDQLDALLTGLVGAVVVRCMDSVIRPFFGRATDQMNELATRVATERDAPEFAEFFKVANEVGVLFRITPFIVIESLREAAKLISVAERTAFASALKLTRSFVLLPADPARRAHLAKLAQDDEGLLSDDALYTDLLEALFIDTTEFAVALVVPSVKMSSIIAFEQGPVSLATLYTDTVAIVDASVKTIVAVGAVGADVAEILGSLLGTGRVTAKQLRQLGLDLKALIAAAADVADAVLNLVRDLMWPIFLTSTGGLGFLLRDEFDAFFNTADWLVERIQSELDRLTDVLIEAIIALAQDVGVLETGDGEDMGSLGQAVRQATLGEGGEPGVEVELLGGQAAVSHAQIATLVTNSVFAKSEVRDHIREMSTLAQAQAQAAHQAALLTATGADVTTVEAALRKDLAARQRPTGHPITIEVVGLTTTQSYASGTRFEIVITGAGFEFVSGTRRQVKVEVGGWPVPIDPAGWWADPDGRLHGQFTVVADAGLDAPHPFVAEGVVSIAPQAQALRAPADGLRMDPQVAAIRSVLDRLAATSGAMNDPARFLTMPLTSKAPSPASALTDEMFLPPALTGGAAVPADRFTAVLAMDRQVMIAASHDAVMIEALNALPGTDETAFLDSSELATLGRDPSDPTSLTGGATGAGTASLTALELAHSAFAEGGPALTANTYPLRIAALARPGCAVVTASVYALPMTGQDRESAPHAQLPEPLWFVLQPPPVPAPRDDAVHAADAADVPPPATMAAGTSAPVTVTMVNRGETTWTAGAGYKLGAFDPPGNTAFGSPTQELPAAAEVAPEDRVTFAFTVNAPPPPGASFQWKLLRDQPQSGSRTYFGEQSPARAVTVPVLRDDASLTATGLPPSMPAGSKATITVTATNTGTTVWTAGGGYRLAVSGVPLLSGPSGIVGAVPGQSAATFKFEVGAPAPPGATMRCQMVRGPTAFGPPTAASTAVVTQVLVPHLKGLEKLDAQEALNAIGLKLASSGSSPFAVVIDQDPVAGTAVSPGSAVRCRMREPRP